MYAIIKSGGKQYKVAKGDVIDVELLEAEDGSEYEFSDVLFFTDGKKTKFGSPGINNFVVKARVIGKVPGPKITSIKYRPSHHQYRKFGHRQKYSRLEILSIGSGE